MTQLPIHLALEDPRNTQVLQCLRQRNERGLPPCIPPPDSPLDPHLHLGSHPEIVERLWDQLAPVLPEDCRCIVYGTPALVAPGSGIVLGLALGTQYVLRLPDEEAVTKALGAGARTVTKWAGGSETDVQREFGKGWVFGHWLKEELDWCFATYRAVEEQPRMQQPEDTLNRP